MQSTLPRFHGLAATLLVLQVFLLGAAPAAPASAPSAAYVSGVVGHAQTYALSCESRSAVDLAAFWGISISETSFFNSLPTSDNPEVGFVGSVHGAWGQIPPNPYGVHAKPVAKTLQKFGLDANFKYNMGFGELKEEIAAGRPVIVWVIGGVWSGSAETYTANNGKQVTVAAYEHTMIAIGYDENYVYLIDAGSGLTQTHSIANFKNSWGVLGNQAVTAKGSGSGGTTTTSSNTDTNTSGGGSSSNSGGSTYIVKSGDYLKKIADQFGMAWTELAALNNINYPWVIHVGQTLKVSGGGNQNNNPPEPTKTPKPTKVPESQGNNNSNNNNNGGSSNYTVQAGDYLASIARKLNVSWTDIADLNGLSSPYVVYAGQVLKIPGGSNNNTPQAQATPKPNSNNNESGENKNPKTYTVQKGDYLVALAREFGVNWQSIATANGIGYPWIVYPGQVITIP